MARRRDRRGGEGAVLTIVRVERTGSTNADMLAMAARGEAREGDWLVADAQTAGRGRQGRVWESPPGNLYASGLVELRAEDPPAATLALVAGVSVLDALGVPGLMLKWPNDILADALSFNGASFGHFAKLAGILLERQGDAIVLGVGINLSHHPDLPDRPTTSLAELGVKRTPDAAIDALARDFANWLARWRTVGLTAIRAAWVERAHPVGTPLAAALPDGSRIEGRFDGLTPDCALQLRLASGEVRVIHAGDVFLV